ncbi:unnamed protein product, partial [Rotaria sordida]
MSCQSINTTKTSDISSSQSGLSSSIKLQQKVSQDISWQEKYYVHGDSSDIVTHIENNVHGYINSSKLKCQKYLDDLQKEIFFANSHDNIKDLSIKADNVKREFLHRLESAPKAKRPEILDKISNISIDKIRQPLDYEQLRELNLKIYSTVGIKPDDQSCDNIPERDRYINDINNTKPRQLID